MDPGEESFTLSSFDFSSSFALYSSDDDDYDHQYRDHDIDAYFELKLPSAAAPTSFQLPPPSDDELELRISFSAVVPFPGFFPNSTNSAIVVSSNANAELTVTPPVDSNVIQSPINGGSLNNRSSIRFLSLPWTRFPPPVDDGRPRINGWDLIRSRKASAVVVNGGITKLVVKLRAIIINGFGSMRASLAHAPKSRRLAPFERWLAFCKPSERVSAVRANVGSSGEVRSSSKVTEIKFEVMRKLFGNAVSPMRYNIGSKSNRIYKSCPTSVKSSPAHQSGDASLVHGAIAHCKKSYGGTDDFSI